VQRQQPHAATAAASAAATVAPSPAFCKSMMQQLARAARRQSSKLFGSGALEDPPTMSEFEGASSFWNAARTRGQWHNMHLDVQPTPFQVNLELI